MITNLKSLYQYRELIYILSWRDIRVRYKQSVMGILWAILIPLVIVGAGVLVQVFLAAYTGQSVKKEAIVQVLIKGILWTLFINGLRFGTNSLISNGSLVTKIAFPKEVFPLSAIISSTYDFMIAMTVGLVILILLGIMPTPYWLLAVPIVLILMAFTAGLSLLLSAANLFYRDVRYLVEVILSFAIFFTPVLYSADMAGHWKPVLMLNPVAPILENFVPVLISGTVPAAWWLLYSSITSAIILIGGYAFFKRLEPRFAENF